MADKYNTLVTLQDHLERVISDHCLLNDTRFIAMNDLVQRGFKF